MANENRLEFNETAWDALLTHVVDVWAEPKAEMIAAQANQEILSATSDGRDDPLPAGKRDYMVSTEGSRPLQNGDYRATVVTVTNRAKAHNARTNTLVKNFHLGGGA